tara:strand:- start:1407 stop:1892 length:486 start_codon:yes stop_codon:yes gene_type:complete
MEKLITKRNLFIIGVISFLMVVTSYFVIQNNNKDEEKLFDIFLADLYNEENANIDDKLYYLSSLDKPTVSFFSDLKLTSIDDLDKYDKIDKDILLLKKALTDLDEQILKSLSLDNSFTFNEIAKIYLLNLNTNNYQNINFDETDFENFFIKAVDRLYNENK